MRPLGPVRRHLPVGDNLQDDNGNQEQDDCDREDDAPLLDETSQQESDEGDCRDRKRIRKLRRDMVDVLAAGSRRGHDGGVADEGAVVAEDCAGKAGGDSDDEERVCAWEDVADNRDEDAEGAPCGAGRECEEACHQEDDCGQECAQMPCVALHGVGDVVGQSEGGGDLLEGGRQGQDENGGAAARSETT